MGNRVAGDDYIESLRPLMRLYNRMTLVLILYQSKQFTTNSKTIYKHKTNIKQDY